MTQTSTSTAPTQSTSSAGQSAAGNIARYLKEHEVHATRRNMQIHETPENKN